MEEKNIENGLSPAARLTLPEDPQPRDIADFIIKILDIKKARDIKLLYVEEKTSIADYFVICTGSSKTQINSLSEEVEFRLSAFGIKPGHIEGKRGDTWLLSDYGSVILHVFSGEMRDFYKLEKLYSEGCEVDISELITED